MSILNSIWSGVTAVFGVIFDGFFELLKWIKAAYDAFSFAFFVVLGLLWFSLVYLYDALNWLWVHWPAIQSVLSAGSGVEGGVQIPAPLAQGFSFLNAILPLSEAMGLISFLLPVWMLAVIFRAVKSWIPTVN